MKTYYLSGHMISLFIINGRWSSLWRRKGRRFAYWVIYNNNLVFCTIFGWFRHGIVLTFLNIHYFFYFFLNSSLRPILTASWVCLFSYFMAISAAHFSLLFFTQWFVFPPLSFTPFYEACDCFCIPNFVAIGREVYPILIEAAVDLAWS